MTRASSIVPGPFEKGGEFGELPPPSEEPKTVELLNDGKPINPPEPTTAGRIASLEAELENRGRQYEAQTRLLNAAMDAIDRICGDLNLDRPDWAKAARGESS
jgi:hypothetical protein